MNKTFKALGLVFLGLIIWTLLVYIAFAFIKAEANPFIWSQKVRIGMIFLGFVYVLFIPLILSVFKEEM